MWSWTWFPGSHPRPFSIHPYTSESKRGLLSWEGCICLCSACLSLSQRTRSPFASGSLDVTQSTHSFQNVFPQMAVSSTSVGEGGHAGVLAAGQCLPQVLLEGTRPHPVAHGSGGQGWLSMVTHILMMANERPCKPQTALGARPPYPCSAAAHHPPPHSSGMFPPLDPPATSFPPASHPLGLMFGQGGKEALIVSREVSDQLHPALLPTLAKPPNSRVLAFCHTPNGGNICHCLCPHRAVTRSDPHRMGLSPLCLG